MYGNKSAGFGEQNFFYDLCGFLLNFRKYGLGSLRKTPAEGTPPTGPGATSGQLVLILQPNLHDSSSLR